MGCSSKTIAASTYYMDPDKGGKSCASDPCDVTNTGDNPQGADKDTCLSKRMTCAEWTHTAGTKKTAATDLAKSAWAGQYAIPANAEDAKCLTKQCNMKDDRATCLWQTCYHKDCTVTDYASVASSASGTICSAKTC